MIKIQLNLKKEFYKFFVVVITIKGLNQQTIDNSPKNKTKIFEKELSL